MTPLYVLIENYRIVNNVSLKALQKSKREQYSNFHITYLWKDDQEKDHFHHLVTAETTRQLHESMDGLPPECSRIVRLLYVEGKTVREIADELHLSVSTVKAQKARGLATLRKKLGVLPFLSIITTTFLWFPLY